MATTVQEVLRVGFADLQDERKFPAYVIQAARKMLSCRTAAMGGHVKRCPHHHVQRVWYNSCGHRACPQCSWLRLEKWLAEQKARLIRCPHYHVVFTIPEELNTLWRYNRKLMADLLFKNVRGTLYKLLEDPKYLGARPGLIAALHTWGKTLVLHPHIHALVTGGGLSPEGHWKSAVKDCLLPRKVLMIIFRGKYLAALRNALAQGQLALPPGTTACQVRGLFGRLGRTLWNVKILHRYDDQGHGVLSYLARYLRGGAISNRRLLSCRDGKVRFRYDDNRDLNHRGRAKKKVMTLSVRHFLLRLLEHVPPSYMHMVRCYGLYANSQPEQLEAAREAQGQGPVELPETADWSELWQLVLPEPRPDLCPVCGAALINAERILPSRAPPAAEALPAPQLARASLQNDKNT